MLRTSPGQSRRSFLGTLGAAAASLPLWTKKARAAEKLKTTRNIKPRNVIFILLLLVIPFLFYLQSRHLQSPGLKPELTKRQIVCRAILAGFLIGGYDGIFGPGTGTFLLFAFMMFLHMNLREASANARIVNYASNVSAFLYFLIQGRIYWPIALVAIAGSISGNWLGSGLVINNANRVVVPVFRFVLGLLMVKCAYELFMN